MVFTRQVSPRRYRDYTRYRDFLRYDFGYRCAYCLIHEFHNGGMANFVIDHHRPVRGAYGRPDLASEYANLYWCCSECNQNKAEIWPTPEQEAAGFRWIDPCEAWGDHDLHWIITPNGDIEWLTSAGEYTVQRLMLHKRDGLKAHWQRLYRIADLRERLRDSLGQEELSFSLQETIQAQIAELDDFFRTPCLQQTPP